MKLTNKQKETLGTVGTGLTSGFGLAATNAQIKDLSAEEALIDSIQNTQFESGSFDNLLQNFDSNNLAKTNYTKEDLRGLSTGEMWRNTLLGTATGALSGAVKGGWVGAAIEGGANLLGGIGGMITSNARASKKAEELNADAKLANQRYVNNFNNAIQNTQNKMFNNSLLNIASYGGPLFNHSEDFSNGVTFVNEGGTHEQNPLGGVPVGVDQEGTPNLVEEGEVIWNDYVFSNRLKPTKKQLEKAGYGDKYQGLPFSRIAEKLQEGSSERPNDTISNNSLNDSLSGLMIMQEEIRMKRRNKENIFSNGGKVNILSGEEELYNKLINSLASQGKPIDIDSALEYVGNKMAIDSRMGINSNLEGLYNFILGRKQILTPETDAEIQSQIDAETSLLEPTYKRMRLDGSIAAHRARLNGSSPAKIKTEDDKIVEYNKSFLSNLRYMSPLIHGMNLINNLKKPDYSAEKNLIRKASTIPGGSFTPIGDYLDLQEIDQNVLLNPILANAAANRRAIQNQGLNAGNTMAGLIASNYTDNNAIGNTLIQGIQNNNNIKAQEAQFNRGTNQANSQMGLQALAMDQQKAQLELSTLANAITSMKQTDAARSTAIGAELGSLADDLAGIGRETSNSKILKGLIDSGVLQDFLASKKKNGGCLNRRKK